MIRTALAALLLLASPALAGPRFDVDVIGPMDGESLASAYAQLLGAEGPEVSLRINSPGGQVFTTLLFIDLAKDRIAEKHLHVTCVVTAAAASAAALLLESGVCQTRVMEPGSFLLFHGVSSSTEGTEEHLEDDVSFVRVLNRTLAAIIAPRIHMTVDAFLDWVRGHDRSVASDSALELGMVDRVEVWAGHAAPKQETPPL